MTGPAGASPSSGSPPPERPSELCPNCQSPRRVRDPARLELHCADCGLVLDAGELVVPVPFGRTDPGTDGSGRGIGPFASPTSPGRRTLGSTLSVSRDGQGRPLNWQRRYEFQHLRRVMQRQTARVAEGPLERSQARSSLVAAGSHLGLPPVIIAEAERLFRDASVRGLFRGRSLTACIGASLYGACRQYSIPRTLGEIARAAGARRSEVGRAFKVMHRGMELTAPFVGARAFLARYAEELALSPAVRSNVEAMLDAAKHDPELSGISAHGLVAALIYLAADRSGEHRSRAHIARVSAVTEVTLRSTSRLVERLLEGPVRSRTVGREPT